MPGGGDRRDEDAGVKALVIWGAGGHARVVSELAEAVGYQIVGRLGLEFETGSIAEAMTESRPFQVHPSALLDYLARHGDYPTTMGSVALGIGDNKSRLKSLRCLGDAPVATLVHPSAALSPSATLGRGTIIAANAVVNAAALVGDAVIVNSGSVVEHDCVLADGVHLSPGGVLAGRVRIGPRSWIGIGAVILPGVCIGTDSIVGAGAVVVRNVPDRVTVVGNPAREIARH